MNKQQTTNNQNTENTWVLLSIQKDRIIKRNDDYVLFNCCDYTAIVSSKFVRHKESETHIFVSVPADYTFNIQKSEFSEQSGRYEVVWSKQVNAPYIKVLLKKDEKPTER